MLHVTSIMGLGGGGVREKELGGRVRVCDTHLVTMWLHVEKLKMDRCQIETFRRMFREIEHLCICVRERERQRESICRICVCACVLWSKYIIYTHYHTHSFALTKYIYRARWIHVEHCCVYIWLFCLCTCAHLSSFAFEYINMSRTL